MSEDTYEDMTGVWRVRDDTVVSVKLHGKDHIGDNFCIYVRGGNATQQGKWVRSQDLMERLSGRAGKMK
jgi:hypothetical protein